MEHENSIILTGLIFDRCSAIYGGAVYIFANHESVEILILMCKFTHNTVINNDNTGTSSHLIGGSSLFLTEHTANITNCKFLGSKGKNGSVKIFNDFTVFDNEAKQQEKNQKHGSIHITNREFQDESSSIFYIAGASGIMTVVNSCIFKGTQKKSDRIIDGIMPSKDAPKLFVVSCIFENELENSISYNVVRSFNTTNQTTLTHKLLIGKKFIAITISGIMIVALSFSIIFVVLKKSTNLESDELPNQA